MAENRTIKEGTAAFHRFLLLLTEACQALALAICRDGEGVTKVVNIEVAGAATVAQARQVAQTIATSNLVKTALFGEDANWGRVMAAIGRAGVPITPSKLSVWFGGVPMVQRGMGLGLAAEAPNREGLSPERIYDRRRAGARPSPGPHVDDRSVV